MFKNRPELVKN